MASLRGAASPAFASVAWVLSHYLAMLGFVLLLGGMLIPLGKLPGWLADVSRVLPASALSDVELGRCDERRGHEGVPLDNVRGGDGSNSAGFVALRRVNTPSHDYA